MRSDRPVTQTALAERNTSLVRLALQKLGQVFCRHSFLLIQQRHPARLFLRCPSCGAETEGFTVVGRSEQQS